MAAGADCTQVGMAAADSAWALSMNSDLDLPSSFRNARNQFFMSKKSSKKSTHALIRVSLRFDLPEAGSVNIAGSFNDWNPASLPMKRLADGRWERDLDLPAGRYEFRLVIDGVWADVPAASDTIENSFGSRNAVLTVTQSS